MNTAYYIEQMDKPIEQHTIESLVSASNVELDENDFGEDDTITLNQYRELVERWDDFRCKCKVELMRRIKDMLHKFAKYGEPGIKALNVLNDLANVTIETDKGINGIFKGWDSYYFYTRDLFGHKLPSLWVNMQECVRGEYDDCDYHFPLEFFDADFDPMTNEKAKSKILEFQTKCGYDNAIPVNPTMEQMQRFLDEYNNDENFKAKINSIFSK